MIHGSKKCHDRPRTVTYLLKDSKASGLCERARKLPPARNHDARGEAKNEAIFACSLFLTKLRDYSYCNFVTVVKQSRAVYHALLNVQIEQSICWKVFQCN